MTFLRLSGLEAVGRGSDWPHVCGLSEDLLYLAVITGCGSPKHTSHLMRTFGAYLSNYNYDKCTIFSFSKHFDRIFLIHIL